MLFDRYLAWLLATVLYAVRASLSQQHAPTASIDAGLVIGTTTSVSGAAATVNKFLGVPFAASPTRFAPPVRPTPWSVPLQATAYGPACPQQFSYPEVARELQMAWFNTPPPPAGESEDCLNLNIYVPGTPGGNKTVMAWIYGGGLAFGANSLQIYDGADFAANQDVILVVLNYRTNILGFPAAPQLPLTERNLGFLDQRMALDWIQRNIAAFGGDPQKVTIFGQSAGGRSVDILVTSMPHNPPFRAAIMESGVANYNFPTGDLSGPWNQTVEALNCTHATDLVKCMRKVDLNTMMSTIEHLSIDFEYTLDNVTALAYSEAARESGHIAHVPILIGTVANDGLLFVLGDNDTQAFLEDSIPDQPALYPAILDAYAIGSPGIGSVQDQISAIETEVRFQCPSRVVARDSRKLGLPTWRYYYNVSFPNMELFPGSGVYHSSEVEIVYGTYPRANATSLEVQTSKYMQRSWAMFAKTPMAGPGWKQVPNVAAIGSPGKDMEVNVQDAVIDKRCGLYTSYYTELGTIQSNVN
ncbi:uncharacterized protein Z520_11948 [Fonsecaea multimorphosa CBS 102226]|uniref:Carboxylic ester hydrolase n=1 Tax=Fonsecaea multimorphosa CBS 102226 TaxID=1442371 RepID=A0A0D2GS73_9EURO|nr:uncharacterized protein Z520_11948 [Fonsecaea multimorphosa CBS 102226]KIX92340.1 hypothetical protein Z520_11948 [Fonsecaea multimorphosa CBS 102226]OAL17714.1 hypothetical protein AYO22_11370 [Fonsecaea multimorphosa]